MVTRALRRKRLPLDKRPPAGSNNSRRLSGRIPMSEPRSPLGQSVPLVPPLYQSSVYTLPDLDALDRIMNAEAPGFIYARDGHPNARYLADRLTTMEGGKWGVVCGS